jgi:hypothetical protein
VLHVAKGVEGDPRNSQSSLTAWRSFS